MKCNFGDLDNFDLQTLKALKLPELAALAQAIRERIIAVVSRNGGHLASNLGVVELTIALHRVFDSPKDKLLFDVSHQTYAHKILTGRNAAFSTLRTFQGMSGYASRSESEHDIFEAGHSSTILSAGVGFCMARVAKPQDFGEIVAVIGDASVTNGLAFEALNFLGAKKNYKMIIIINDNDMSISKNVGSLARTFNRIRVKWHSRAPLDEKPRAFRAYSSRIKRTIKSYIYNNQFFTALGFKYFEGIDGHNLKELIRYFNYAKTSKQSIVLHVKTQKGKGYCFAEEDNTGIWHGVGPFDIASGVPKNQDVRRSTFGEVIANYLLKIAQVNSDIRVITPAMTLGSGLQNFKTLLPQQFIDVGIAEESAVVMASALALSGLFPVVFIYSTFLQRSYDQLLHDIARIKVPVLFCVDRSGIVDDDGDTHQGIFDVAFLRTIPFLTLTMPKDSNEAKALVDLAFRHSDGPFVIRYPKLSFIAKQCTHLPIEYGRWEIIFPLQKQTIISYGPDVLEIQALLEKEQLGHIGLVNSRFLKPLDLQLLASLNKIAGTVYVYEQVIKTGSLAAAILEQAPTFTVFSTALPESFLQTGKVGQLKKAYGIDLAEFIKNL